MMNIQTQSMLQCAIQFFKDDNFERADLVLKKAIKENSSSVDIIFELAVAYAKADSYRIALHIFNYLAPLKKDDLKVSYNIGLIHSLLGNNELALEAYDLALAIDPDDVATLIHKGTVCNDIKQYVLALELFNRAIKLRPDMPEVWLNKGLTLHELKRFDEAITHYDQALTRNPDYAQAWSNKGVSLHELKRFDEAITHYDQALTRNPDYAQAWSNKGLTLHELGRFDEAITHYDQALTFNKDYEEVWLNKGLTLHGLKRFDEAITHYDQALTRNPDYAQAWSNKGLTLHELGRFDEAITHYDQALSCNSNYCEATWNKSLSLLIQGDFENGLSAYESRLNSDKVSEDIGRRLFIKPNWLGGESIQDKKILIYGEQGLGDLIQFCRYIKLVAALGADVIFEVPQSLVGLMENLEGVSQLVIKGQELPFFDYTCSLMSLPLAFKTDIHSIPSSARYLNVDPCKIERWKIKLGEKRKKRVGLVWSSVSNFENDSTRSMAFSDFSAALPLEGFEYVCLQKELKECDKRFFKAYKNVMFFGDELRDFADTAALIENVDLIISTCTSVPHLAAALGKETWVLLPYVPDWRWLLDRVDSPWYPSIKLYRQKAIGDWNAVLESVKSDLNSY